MVRLCLNCIVKDESARIERMLDSVTQFIHYAVIVDTGSTDDTKKKIKKWFSYYKVPFEIYEAPFIDWSQARNAALAYGRRAWMRDVDAFDYFLLCDADMELKVFDRTVLDTMNGPSYDAYQIAGSCHYQNRRFFQAQASGKYVGVTHEYLDVPSAGLLPKEKLLFIDHADGANRPEKFKRDIKLLRTALKSEPNNERYFFYLAQSYRDAGDPANAAKWYQRRVAAGGWDEEVWQAQVNYAHCLLTQKDEGGFLREMMLAYQMRPSRAETLYDLAKYYREKGMNAPATAFAEVGLSIPPSKDALFVQDYVYRVGFLEELSIAAFYVPGKEKLGRDACERLSLMRTPYEGARALGRRNLFWYLQSLTQLCPSFCSYPIDWTPPAGWVAMNPSITRFNGFLVVNVRTVNYTMDERGRYLIKDVADDGTTGCNATAENPIHTRNWLLQLTEDFRVLGANEILLPPSNELPCEFPLVVGFEDMRIFQVGLNLMSSSTVRQIAADGQCEQVLAHIEGGFTSSARIGNYWRMLRQPRVTEKNWMPFVRSDTDWDFIYKLGERVDTQGRTFQVQSLPINADDLRGGTQLVPFFDGYIALVHEAGLDPGTGKRYYMHRFVFFSDKGNVQRISTPFFFEAKQIEYAAGLALQEDHLIISYGVNDAAAHLGTVSFDDVRALLGF